MTATAAVDGTDRPIRRSQRRGSPTYSVNLGMETIDDGRPVKISYTYRTLTVQEGHLLHLDFEQPSRGVFVELS